MYCTFRQCLLTTHYMCLLSIPCCSYSSWQNIFPLSLFFSDKMMEMSRKIGIQESTLSRVRAENYKLKVKIEEVRSDTMDTAEKVSADAKKVKKKGRTITEKLDFAKEDGEEKRAGTAILEDEEGDCQAENRFPKIKSKNIE